MKGIILAGGLGTRLYPSSLAMNKHLMPVYDKPMIYYPLSTLMLAGIRDVLIISSPEYLPSFQTLLANGKQWGMNFSYAPQAYPRGIGEAILIGEKFIGQDNVCLILGDNILQGAGLEAKLTGAKEKISGATLFAYYVENPGDYGVIEFDVNSRPLSIVEKPTHPKSNYALTGLYFYDNQVIEVAKSIQPSLRNELEISDINAKYLQKQQAHVEILGRGFTWLDMGTHSSLLKASHYIEVIETRQGLKIGCPEEIAWRKGYISTQELKTLAQKIPNTHYAKYLTQIVGH